MSFHAATMRAARLDRDRPRRRAPGRGRPPPAREPLSAVAALAHAKVNLRLEVLGGRPDGYHDIRSLVVPLDLADRLVVAPAPRGVGLEVLGAPELAGPDNLVARAAQAFRRRFGAPRGVRILLDKRVPITAGLGGGSSDAASTLRALAKLAGVDDEAALRELALSLGSDVPFFLGNGPAWIAGRGERVEPAAALPQLWLLLVKPPFGVTAREAYEAWSASHRRLTRPDRNANQSKVERAPSGEDVFEFLRNDLEAGVARAYPRIRDLLSRLRRLSPRGTLMSGSGSTCFALFRDRPSALRARAAFRPTRGERVLLARTLAWRTGPHRR